MNQAEVRDIFERYDVLQAGHFRLSSGRHSDTYLQCQHVLGHPRLAASLGEAIAHRFGEGSFNVVLSPALGGILIGNAVAYAANVRFVFAERVEGEMKLRRGQSLGRTDRALVVEDVITTGGSAAEVIALAEAAQAAVAGVGSLVDRSSTTPAFHLAALLRVEAANYAESECPMCARGEALSSPGSRHRTSEGS
ncbi:MAG: orotate phosphoribosyltransferase [Actinomycetota bacterium]